MNRTYANLTKVFKFIFVVQFIVPWFYSYFTLYSITWKMGFVFSKIFNALVGSKELRILILGSYTLFNSRS
jgi:hypothetical protein